MISACEFIPLNNVYLVSLVLFGNNQPSISPPSTSPKMCPHLSSQYLGGKPHRHSWQSTPVAADWGPKGVVRHTHTHTQSQSTESKNGFKHRERVILSNDYLTATREKIWSLCLPRQLTWQPALVPSWLNHAMPPGWFLMAHLLCPLQCWYRGQAFSWFGQSWSAGVHLPPAACSGASLLALSRWEGVWGNLAGSPTLPAHMPETHTSLFAILIQPSMWWPLCFLTK